MGTFKLIFGIFVIVAGIYLGAELIPVYYENYQLRPEIYSRNNHEDAKNEFDRTHCALPASAAHA